MKLIHHISILIIAVSILACSDPKNQIITDFEQDMGDNASIDLNLDVNSIEYVRQFTAVDSMRIIHESLLSDEFDPSINWIDSMFLMYRKSLESIDQDVMFYDSMMAVRDNPEIKAIYLEGKIKVLDDRLEVMEGKNKYEIAKIRYDHYASQPEKELGKIYDVQYTIINPMLNNAKQTINKTYLFSLDDTEILSVLE